MPSPPKNSSSKSRSARSKSRSARSATQKRSRFTVEVGLEGTPLSQHAESYLRRMGVTKEQLLEKIKKRGEYKTGPFAFRQMFGDVFVRYEHTGPYYTGEKQRKYNPRIILNNLAH